MNSFVLYQKELCQIITIVCYGILLIYTYKNRRYTKFDQTTFTYLTWFIASIMGYFYLHSEICNVGLKSPEFSSVFIAFGLFILYTWPIYFLRERTLDNYQFEDNKIIYYLCIFVSIICIVPFAENLVHLSDAKTRSEIGMLHDELVIFKEYNSPIGKTCANILRCFKFIIPVLFFNYVNTNNKKINKLVVIGLLCAYFNDSLAAFCRGSRFLAVIDGLRFVFLYLLMRKTISFKIKAFINKSFGILAGIVLFLFVILSIARFGDRTNESVLESYYRYAGEGFNNLYADMMYVDRHTYGMHIFRSLFGDENTPDTLTLYMGIRMFVYYTFMGDFIADFGILGSVVIFILISSIIYITIIKKKTFSFFDLIILGAYATVFNSGFMYTAFMNYGLGIKGFLCFIIIYGIIHYGEESRKRSINNYRKL